MTRRLESGAGECSIAAAWLARASALNVLAGRRVDAPVRQLTIASPAGKPARHGERRALNAPDVHLVGTPNRTA